MNFAKIKDILPKTDLKNSLSEIITSFKKGSSPNFKPLLIQIISIDRKNSSIIISDMKHNFLVHLTNEVLDLFKNEVNSKLTLSNLAGCVAVIKKWKMDYFFDKDKDRLWFNFQILKIDFVDGLNNEILKDKYFCVFDFENYSKASKEYEDIKDLICSFKNELLKSRRRGLIGKNSNESFSNFIASKIQQKKNQKIVENNKNNHSPNSKKPDQDNTKGNDSFTGIQNDLKNMIIDKKDFNNFKLIYDYYILSEIINKNPNDDFDDSSISGLDSIDLEGENVNLTNDLSIIKISSDSEKKNVVTKKKFLETQQNRLSDSFELKKHDNFLDSIDIKNEEKNQNNNNDQITDIAILENTDKKDSNEFINNNKEINISNFNLTHENRSINNNNNNNNRKLNDNSDDFEDIENSETITIEDWVFKSSKKRKNQILEKDEMEEEIKPKQIKEEKDIWKKRFDLNVIRNYQNMLKINSKQNF